MILVQDFKLLCPDHLSQGVHNTFAMNSEVYNNIAWEQINSLTYKYNVADELPDVQYRAINGSYAENTARITQAVENLVILGGDADVDVMLQYSSNLNDLKAIQTELKAKAVIRQFEKDFFKGTGEATYGEDNSLRGLDKRLAEDESGVGITGTVTGTPAKAIEELQLVYKLMASVKNPTHLFMSKSTHVKFIMMLHNAGVKLHQTLDTFGVVSEYFNKCKVTTIDDELIPADKIYCVSFDKDNMRCVTSSGLQVRDLGELDNKPVYRTRIELSVALVVSHKKAFGVLGADIKNTTLEAEATKK